MATVRKRTLPSGLVTWQANYVDRDGKRRSTQFRTRRAADAYLLTVRHDLREGRHVAPGASITVQAAGDLWLERCERDRLARSTLKQYRAHMRLHIVPAIGSMKLSDLTAPRVYEFAGDLLAKTSRPMARKILTSLSSALDEAVRAGRHSHNPARMVDLPRVRAEEREGDAIEMPTKDELRAILNAATGRWRPLIATAMFTGLRGSELRGLQWPDIDLAAAVLHVRRRADEWNNFGPPKSKAGKRTIPLPSMVINELKRWRLACPRGEHDLVFPAPDGKVVSHSCILKDGFGPLQVRAGVVRLADAREGVGPFIRPKFGLHALRHAAAALFIEQGFSPKRVQQFMGHASIKMTFDVYGYLFRSDEDDQAAMRAIELRLLQG